ncbi:MAG TPA: hypothetical protein ENK23_06535, partial [Sorangium sp.]|nr:hypothetical protein [Sorangium sp.]
MTRKSDKKHHTWSARWSAASRSLLHPLWLAALALLVVNDQLLKTAGVLPTWLTGKLSDFAGLVVAPVLLVALLGLRKTKLRALAVFAVAAVFAAIHVSPIAAHALEQMTAWLGVPWRIVVDPSDMIALAVLPLAWHIIKRGDVSARALPRRPQWQRFAQPALALVASVACMATSQVNGPGGWSTGGFLVNDTGQTLTVRVRPYHGVLDCSTMAMFPERMLARDGFGTAVTFELAAHDTLPLDIRPLGTAAGWPLDGENSENSDGPLPQLGCEVVMIESDGLPSTIGWWTTEEVPPRVVATNADAPNFVDLEEQLRVGRVDIILDSAERPAIHARGAIHMLRPQDPIAPSDCGALGAPVKWSNTDAVAGAEWR